MDTTTCAEAVSSAPQRWERSPEAQETRGCTLTAVAHSLLDARCVYPSTYMKGVGDLGKHPARAPAVTL